MGRGVVIPNCAVAGAGDDFAVLDQRRAYRRLAARGGGLRLGEGAVPGIEDMLQLRQIHLH